MKKIFSFLLLSAILSCFTLRLFAQMPVFKKGDRVCFVGNSITFNGGFHHDIFAFYATRFPDQRVDFFNCGVGGDVTSGVLRRMESDILINKPTYAVIKIGMNDIKRALYTKTSVNNADTIALKADALKVYKERLEQIIKIFLDKGVKVILQKPTIYDQTSKQTSIVFPGCNDALKICAGYVQEFADKYKLISVDYWTILNRINLEMQAKDSTATIIGRDRVHPGTAGNFIMAYEFLKATGAPKEVADINIAKNKTDSKVGDKITGVAYMKSGLSFTALEKALPFPLADFRQAATMVPFIEAMDQETLKVVDILPGKYKLTIDTFSAGTYTADQLAAGINLATVTTTPQMAQSMKVYATLQDIWKNEANNRLVKQIETSQAYIDYPDKQNMPALTHNLDSINTNRPNPNSTLKKEIALYADAKAGEATAYKKIDELRVLVYEINKPVPHVFKLQKL